MGIVDPKNLPAKDIRFAQFTLNRTGHTLKEDGVYGPKTEAALAQAYLKVLGLPSTPEPTPAPPPIPNSAPTKSDVDTTAQFLSMSKAERESIFGKYEYRANADGTIQITDGWEKENIVSVAIPQLQGKPLYSLGGSPFHGSIRVHRLVAGQFKAFFAEIERRGLVDRILTFDGAFYARMIRGSKTSLSNHAFGTAIDINAEWNGLGREPAEIGRLGCLLELVPIAHRFGLYWGGNFVRQDGMHFEVAKVLDL